MRHSSLWWVDSQQVKFYSTVQNKLHCKCRWRLVLPAGVYCWQLVLPSAGQSKLQTVDMLWCLWITDRGSFAETLELSPYNRLLHRIGTVLLVYFRVTQTLNMNNFTVLLYRTIIPKGSSGDWTLLLTSQSRLVWFPLPSYSVLPVSRAGVSKLQLMHSHKRKTTVPR
jgi:hypothetical protein